METRTTELINWLEQWGEDYKREEIKEIIERLKELDWYREEKRIEDATWK